MSRRVVNEIPEPERIKLRELRFPDLKYLEKHLIEHYYLYPKIYNFLVRKDDRDLPGRKRENVQSIVIYYCLERDDNYFNLTVDIDFNKIYYIEDILKRVILEVDNALIKKEYKLKEFQYKYYKEPLLIGKKFISEEDKVNVFYNPVNPKDSRPNVMN